MNLAKLKAKNQVTLPHEVVKKLDLKPEELFQVDVVKNNIVLIPVEIKPKYSEEELKAIDRIIEKNKKKGKTIKAGKKFSKYINGLK